MRRTAHERLWRAFTLVELLVVMLVMSIVALLTVPAFSTFSRSNSQTQAREALKAGLRAAHEAALSSSPGEDVVAVFVQGLGGQSQVVLARRAGTVNDVRSNSATTEIKREVFVPIDGAPTVSLPPGYSVRGYVGAGVLGDAAAPTPDWYASSAGTPGIYVQSQSAWVAPETHLFKHVYNDGGLQTDDDGADRNTFMMRFEGGTGNSSRSLEAVLVVLPRNSATGRGAEPWASNRLDLLVDSTGRVRTLRAAVDAILNGVPDSPTPFTNQGQIELARRQLLGHASSDTVLAGPAARVAVYEEAALAAAFTIRLDPIAGTIYRTGSGDDSPPATAAREAAFYAPGTAKNAIGPNQQINALRKGTYATVHEAIDGWLLGDTNLNGTFGDARATTQMPVIDIPAARVFMVDRLFGEPVEVPAPPAKVEGP